jgi:sigma-E factor negative regulatory protein RseC
MIEMQARIVDLAPGSALVEPMSNASCSSCASSAGTPSAGCGADKIGQIFTLKQKRYRVIDPLHSRLGDEVIIGIEEGAVLRGSVAVYILPLLLVFTGALVAPSVAPHLNPDFAAISGAAIGFIIGVIWLLAFNQRVTDNPHYQPIILRNAHDHTFTLKHIQQ